MRAAPVASITSRSKPSAHAARRRHLRQRGKKVLVDRIALAVHALLLRHLGLEAAALLGRIGELAEAVGELDAAGIELEALGHPRVAAVWAAPAPLRRPDIRSRIVGRPMPSLRLDPLDQDAAEDVAPAVVVGDADAGLARLLPPAHRDRHPAP